jgi:pantoate--beta-alanine ligase
MGALHEGHLSLIRYANRESDLCTASIFVNPTQFNDPADFKKYPVTIESDIQLLGEAGCDVLFLPVVEEVYRPGSPAPGHYQLGYLETILEGEFRPGHFQGVCMVVERLLNLVRPDDLFIGQKDYQQCLVIRRLLELTGLGQNIRLHISPTLREQDGLAMSSRNMRLRPEARKKAPEIYRTLCFIRDHINNKDFASLKEEATRRLTGKQFTVDYVEIADAATLLPADRGDGQQKLVALVAAFLDEVRLIDNMLLS